MANGWVKAVNSVTDALGLTDTESADRAHEAMEKGQKKADSKLDSDLAGSLNALATAAKGRDLGTNLTAYDKLMGRAQKNTSKAGNIALGQQDAGIENVKAYMNPQMQQMLDRTMQTMQGGAGAALQSSATNKDISTAVANQAGNIWQQAFQNSLNDAQNNLNVASSLGQSAGQSANMAGQQLTADNQPVQDLLNLQNDRAMQRYAANTGMTQADMQLAGQKHTLL